MVNSKGGNGKSSQYKGLLIYALFCKLCYISIKCLHKTLLRCHIILVWITNTLLQDKKILTETQAAHRVTYFREPLIQTWIWGIDKNNLSKYNFTKWFFVLKDISVPSSCLSIRRHLSKSQVALEIAHPVESDYLQVLPSQFEACVLLNHPVSDVIKKGSKFSCCYTQPRRKAQESSEKVLKKPCNPLTENSRAKRWCQFRL